MTETFGQLLRRMRLERGLSQRQLRRRAYLAQGYLCRLESPDIHPHQPSRSAVCSLAAALGLDEGETDHLLIAAGFWPWHMPDPAIDLIVEAVRSAMDDTLIRRRTG